MQAAAGVAAANMMKRTQAEKDQQSSKEADENEQQKFELSCRLLDTKQFSGFERLQVEMWLLFEDQTSSVWAFLTQGVLLLLIVFSTALVVMQSSTNECGYMIGPTAGRSWEDLQPCTTEVLTSPLMVDVSCERVCRRRLEPLEEGGPLWIFILDAVCIGIFTIEFLMRMIAAPATIGFKAFAVNIANIVDLVAILPFYIDVAIYLSAAARGSGSAQVLRVLRIIRLSRVARVLKFSKNLSGVIVLFRTLYKSLAAMGLIFFFSIFMCILWASVMTAVTRDVGTFVPDPVLSPPGHLDPAGQYLREDSSQSWFSDIFEVWWWCLQTLTSEGYGVPWVPVTDLGKAVSIITALFGTVVLALPIAVVGVTFDDEWVKQAKINQFAAESCVFEYNSLTRSGTQEVPQSVIKDQKGSWHIRMSRFLGTCFVRSYKHEDSVSVHPDLEPADEEEPMERKRLSRAKSFVVSGSDSSAALAASLADEGSGGGKSPPRRELFRNGEANDSPGGVKEQAEAQSERGTLFSADNHRENQAYNLQADLHTLIDSHFTNVRSRTRVILNEQREKLCRSLNTDLKAALRENALKTSAVDAFREKLLAKRNAQSGVQDERSANVLRMQSLTVADGFVGSVARASLHARSQAGIFGVKRSTSPKAAQTPGEPPESSTGTGGWGGPEMQKLPEDASGGQADTGFDSVREVTPRPAGAESPDQHTPRRSPTPSRVRPESHDDSGAENPAQPDSTAVGDP